MKKLLFIVSPLLIIVLLLFVFRHEIEAATHPYLNYSACDTPIRYSVGEIDSQFNLSEDELLRRAQISSDIWEQAYGKALFKYDPASPFTINVVYDGRQGLSTEADTLNSELKQESGTYEQELAAYKSRVTQFKKNQTDLNSDIQYWNRQGGAPEAEYNSLKQRQEALENEADELQILSEKLNQSADTFNAQAAKLRDTVTLFNNSLKEKPEGGIYSQQGEKKSITIYFNNSEKEFIYTLTHEMGHALGLPHNLSSDSIMYPKASLTLTPSELDLKDLESACAEKNVITTYFSRMKSNLNKLSDLLPRF